MEGADWLKTQLTSFGCAACGQAYGPGRIRILAQREELFFVDLGCETCGAQAVAVVTIQPDESVAADMDLAAGPGGGVSPPAAAPAPVAADDLLDMSEFLSRFDGDFRSLFEEAQAGPSRDGS